MRKKKNNKKKKGFTLIELLAVILILGIIALIAIPQVTNVIGTAHKGAVETSAKHYIDAVTNKIALSKLETSSANKIEDGIVSVENIQVDVTGSIPESGSLTIKGGEVKFAEFVVDGYSVTCDSKGKCNAINGTYVYYASTTNVGGNSPESVSDCSETRPENYPAYLKYSVINNRLQDAQSCIYMDGEELCLNPHEHEISKSKMLDFYDYNETSWTNLQGTNQMYKDISDSTYYCEFYDSGSLKCVKSGIQATTSTNGQVSTSNSTSPYLIICNVANSASCAK